MARNTPEWVDALVGLARDDKERSKLGEAGRRRVIEKFSVERWAPTLSHLLQGA